MSSPEQPEESGKPTLRRILLTILGGVSLSGCSWVAFFSFRGTGLIESMAVVTYASLFLAGIVLFLGGCVQAAGFLYRKFKGAS
jgi:hypothetical protein